MVGYVSLFVIEHCRVKLVVLEVVGETSFSKIPRIIRIVGRPKSQVTTPKMLTFFAKEECQILYVAL